jgi:hypothetical protein
MATDLFHYDWYKKGIRLEDPLLILPSTFLWEEVVIASTHNVQYVTSNMKTGRMSAVLRID